MKRTASTRFRCAACPAIRVDPLAVRVHKMDEALVREPFGPVAITYGPPAETRHLPEDLILREVRELDFSDDAFKAGRTLRSVVEFMRSYGPVDPADRYEWGLFDS